MNLFKFFLSCIQQWIKGAETMSESFGGSLTHMPDAQAEEKAVEPSRLDQQQQKN